jgi:hypothetical protein
MGLGVDRAVSFAGEIKPVCPLTAAQLQFKVVTPDGRHRVANACQNKDLFFALRGGDLSLAVIMSSIKTASPGGGGTFGVALESSVLASPPVTLQTFILTFAPNATLTEALFKILVDNGIKWAKDGFGGFATSEIAIYLTPKLTKAEAAASMAPLIEFGKRLERDGAKGARLIVVEFPTWGAFFESFVKSNVAVGWAMILDALQLRAKLCFLSFFFFFCRSSDPVSRSPRASFQNPILRQMPRDQLWSPDSSQQAPPLPGSSSS